MQIDPRPHLVGHRRAAHGQYHPKDWGARRVGGWEGREAMGPLADEIRDAIDEVREEGGGASDLAHELWDPKA